MQSVTFYKLNKHVSTRTIKKQSLRLVSTFFFSDVLKFTGTPRLRIDVFV